MSDTPCDLAACSTLRAHDLGVLVAPPGAGKTVMATSLIAHHGVSTLVLVDRKALAEQWRSRLTHSYGLVVVDECHHVPAAAFTDAIRQIRARAGSG